MVLQYHKRPENIKKSALFFCIRDQELLIFKDKRENPIPVFQDLISRSFGVEKNQYLGMWNQTDCYVVGCSSEMSAPAGMLFANLRLTHSRLGDQLWSLAGLAFHLGHWYRTHQFCGRCGLPLQDKTEERARVCLHCQHIVYPGISPAVIVAISKGDEILLAQAHRFKGGFYSVLAGFVEPGETLEDCVIREVKEESGIDIQNIQYFGSQPWPFPNALMVGFTADYAGGDLVLQDDELSDAGWYRYDALPRVPGSLSIASRLIQNFVNQHEK